MSLRRATASAVKWKGAAAAIGQVLQFVRLVILARLVPGDFGLMAMITVVIGVADTFSDGGLNSAIIHRQDVTREQLTSLYWFNLATGIVVFALVWALSPLPWVLARKGLRRDDEGNIRHTRHLPDGQQFEIIKNFPTRAGTPSSWTTA
jgi:O-antigen/teichoic acid export membrane protein